MHLIATRIRLAIGNILYNVHTVCSENVRVCIKYINILERINYEKCKKDLPPFSGVVRPPESVVRKVNCKKML